MLQGLALWGDILSKFRIHPGADIEGGLLVHRDPRHTRDWVTPQGGEPVDDISRTLVERALRSSPA